MKWWMSIPVGIGVLFAVLRGGGKKDKSGNVSYSVDDWDGHVELLSLNAFIEPAFAKEWIRIESGGNPCAWGSANAKGPDGYPREQGIGQFYNPDDFDKLGIPSGSLRVYCIPGTQKCSRLLTADEMMAQAKALVGLIVKCREKAGRYQPSKWSGKDKYKLVKLVHGLPGLVTQGMPRVTKKLGRSPNDWQEFKTAINETMLDAGTERYRSLFPRLFLNAEKTASKLTDDVRIVS